MTLDDLDNPECLREADALLAYHGGTRWGLGGWAERWAEPAMVSLHAHHALAARVAQAIAAVDAALLRGDMTSLVIEINALEEALPTYGSRV